MFYSDPELILWKELVLPVSQLSLSLCIKEISIFMVIFPISDQYYTAQIHRKLCIWSHSLTKYLMEHFIFLCSVNGYRT